MRHKGRKRAVEKVWRGPDALFRRSLGQAVSCPIVNQKGKPAARVCQIPQNVPSLPPRPSEILFPSLNCPPRLHLSGFRNKPGDAD
jgi:hypothetical protein